MSFTRTGSGLSNLALFHGAEFVVYTEGGVNSYSADEVLSGAGDKSSVDIKFWSSVFRKFGYNRRVKFKSVGSKSSSNRICDLIVSGQLDGVIVARDSDLDDFLKLKYDSPFILYTRGYSWENDVYDRRLVQEQIEAFVMEQEFPEYYRELIKESYDFFYSKALSLLKLELIFRKQGERLICGMAGERFVNGKSNPKIRIDQVRAAVKEKKSVLERPVDLSDFDLTCCPIKYCYGKLQEALAISLIYHIASVKEGFKSVPKDIMVATMIDRYGSSTGLSSDSYYRSIIDRLKAA
ncbi:MAG: DUF4435 domain-containing protein [Pseudomonadales bacterium]|nr:DUF4435 domain-containing protein [Pseudomonadales bacterium]